MFGLDLVFSDQYQPLFQKLGALYAAESASAVRHEVHLLASVVLRQERQPISALLTTLREAGLGLPATLLERLTHENICLSCLAHQPFRRLTCAHRFCDGCIRRYNVEASCVVCGVANMVAIQIKPANGGVRALSLGGGVADAFTLARFLQSLRRELRSPLHGHFDFVQVTGVGIFFGLMLFCKQASIEECIHLIPGIRYVKVSRRGFKFGRRLDFSRDELHSNIVVSSTDTTTCAAEARLLWPGCKLDALLEFRGGEFTAKQITSAAEKLLASLFYVELEESPEFGSGPADPVVVRLRVQCRLPPGPSLMDFILRLRTRRCTLVSSGGGPPTVSEVCPDIVWDRVRKGLSFVRLLCVRATSPQAAIRVEIEGVLCVRAEATKRLVSNCPCMLERLVAGKRDSIIPLSGTSAAAWGQGSELEPSTLGVIERLEKLLGGLS